MNVLAKNNGPGDRPIESDGSPDVEMRQRTAGDQPLVPGLQTCQGDAFLRITKDLLNAYAYNGLLDVLSRNRPNEENHFRDVRALLHHGMARLNMNFKKAAEILRVAVSDEVLTARVAKPFRDTAECGPLTLQRLQEICWAAQVFLSRGDYGNFVVRSTMLLETARRQLAHSLIGLKATRPIVSPDRLDPELNQMLDTTGMYKQNGDWLNTKPFLCACIQWGKQQLDDQAATEVAAGVQKCIADLKTLEELRNDFVHQSKGIAKTDIENHWDGVGEVQVELMDLLHKMKELQNRLGKQTRASSNVYIELNQAVLRAMRNRTVA